MNILYAIQGTGNGHVSRALDIIPELKRYGNVDILISGSQCDLPFSFPVKYKLKGASFVFGKKGGIDFWKTLKQSEIGQLMRDIRELPAHSYDLVISDFEPVSSWACRLRNKPCIGLGHQIAVMAPEAPKPVSKDRTGNWILNHYAPCSAGYGFHFKSYNPNIFTPVIRRGIRYADNRNDGHYTVYLPAYDDEKIIRRLHLFKDVEWQVFSKHTRHEYRIDNIHITPVRPDRFTESITSCEGVLCGAGFETPAEALYLGKKLLVVPMKGQYEQHCNAAALSEMGIPVIKNLKKKNLAAIEKWLNKTKAIRPDYPDSTADIIEKIVLNHSPQGNMQGYASWTG